MENSKISKYMTRRFGEVAELVEVIDPAFELWRLPQRSLVIAWRGSDGSVEIYVPQSENEIVVPVEPQEKMLAAIEPALDMAYDGGNKGQPSYEDAGASVYKAMLAESPASMDAATFEITRLQEEIGQLRKHLN